MHIVWRRALGALALCGGLVHLVVLVVGVGACSSSDSNKSGGVALTLSATIGTGAVSTVTNGIKANGASSVTLSISGAVAGPIRVTTPKGSFTGGAKSASIDGTSGSVTFIACDAHTDSSCAGKVVISALDSQNDYGEIDLQLVGFEASCTNGLDSNGDGRIGCADPDCDTKSCSASGGVTGTCTTGACVPPVCTPTSQTEICDNGIDDDCDNTIDCAAASCDGQACKQGSPTFLCRSQACTDIGSGYAITVTSARSRLPANGTATTTVTAKVTKSTVIQPDIVVSFATDLGTLAQSTATTGTDGTASVTYTASAASGVATVTAALRDVPQVSQTTFITMPALGSITLGGTQEQVMGVKSSGFNEQNAISVLLLDTDQKPYPDGLDVRFEHQQLGSSSISTPFAADTATCVQANGCLAFIGATASPAGMSDTTGLASVNLYSGTAAGPVSINVSASAGGVTRNFTVQNIAIVGAKASSLQISVSCTPDNVAALTRQDCLKSQYDGPGSAVACTVSLADRFGNLLGVQTRADFRSEAGAAGPPVLTTAYDPTMGGDQSKTIGHATDSVVVTGYNLPVDVDPIAGEFSRTYDPDGCGTKTHNPRDGASAVIVSVQGEEGFVDTNGNGVYDLGEPFYDSGEPFVDVNDNNQHDTNEPFIDVNQNGVWDGPNGKWDANTVIWAETRILYTGIREARWINLSDATTVPAATSPVSFDVTTNTSETFEVFVSDDNVNPPPGDVTTYSVKSSNGNVSATIGPAVFEGSLFKPITFIQQLCATKPPSAPSGCSNICRSSPCYRVTSFGPYAYGWHTPVTISGSKVGGDTLTFTATVDETSLSSPILGTVH